MSWWSNSTVSSWRPSLQSDLPVVVDFWAQRSAPCLLVLPALEAIAAENPATIEIVTLNTDRHPATTAKYSVMNLPTLIVYHRGEVVQTIVAPCPKAAIEHDPAVFLRP